MRYVGGTADGAAIQWSGAGSARVVNMGFPFETITTAANRDAVMHAVLDFFNLSITVPAPATPDLLASSDTGLSFNDNLTRLNNATPGGALQFSIGNTIAGLTVSLFADGVLIGSAVANGSSTTIITNGSLPLNDGVHAITARQELAGNPPSAMSQWLAVTIDTTPPSAVSAMFQFQTDHGLRFAFDSAVGVMSASDLSLVNLTTMQTIPTAAIAMTVESASAMRFTFPGLPAGILGDGNYRARIAATDLTDLAGNPLAADAVLEFFVLGGDANRDRAVNQADLDILTMNWQQSPATFSQGDFSYDGRVDSRDLLILAANWQRVLSLPVEASVRRARRVQELELRAILVQELG